jgi:spore coat polysaccharide biosynthesis protein SpsF
VETAAFVQARMGSTRLPGKVLAPIGGRPALLRVVERLGRVPRLETIVVLTSHLAADDPITEVCAEHGVPVLRGDEDDVLDRFHDALREFPVARAIRITADCPLIDPEVVAALVALHEGTPGLAYASVATGALGPDSGYRRFPDGLDAEVFTAASLEQAWRSATDPYEREHVTPFIWRRPKEFPSAVLESEVDHGDERWTVDFPEDLELVRAVYDRLRDGEFGWRDVITLLDREPALRRLNRRHRVPIDSAS